MWPTGSCLGRSHVIAMSAPFTFSGHAFQILDGTALFWPARKALLVADLHLEKASWFASKGQMLPPQDSQATLDRLEHLVAETAAREVWCLGDNFHDAAGVARLPDAAQASLARLTGGTAWHWIIGNHDEGLAGLIGGRIMVEAEVDGLILRHRADPTDGRAELSGHFHPQTPRRRQGPQRYPALLCGQRIKARPARFRVTHGWIGSRSSRNHRRCRSACAGIDRGEGACSGFWARLTYRTFSPSSPSNCPACSREIVAPRKSAASIKRRPPRSALRKSAPSKRQPGILASRRLH